MKYLVSFLFMLVAVNSSDVKTLGVIEFTVDDPAVSNNIFTANEFSIAKSALGGKKYYILSSKRNDNPEIFQKIFLNTKHFEAISEMKSNEELAVCVYYYKKELGYRDDVKLSNGELASEIKFIDRVVNQPYYYDYCGTNMFIKKTKKNSLLLLINNSYQTPSNWYDLNQDFIEIKEELLTELLVFISK
jgi:hypothetical protein